MHSSCKEFAPWGKASYRECEMEKRMVRGRKMDATGIGDVKAC